MFLAVLLASTLLLTACSSPEPVQTTEIAIRDGKFVPQNVKAKTTETIWWTNETSERYVLSFESDRSVEIFIEPGEKKGFVFTQSGEYVVYCKIHRQTKGRLFIEASEA